MQQDAVIILRLTLTIRTLDLPSFAIVIMLFYLDNSYISEPIRHVCTYLNAFLIVISNIVIHFGIFEEEKVKFLTCRLHTSLAR